jgi:hypothetical protein
MATGQLVGPYSVLDMTFKVASGTTITGYQAVKAGTNGGEIAVSTTYSDVVLGITQVNPAMQTTYAAGKYVTVRMLGISKCVAAAAVTSGTRVSSIGGGAVAAQATAGAIVAGIALEQSYSTGELIDVLLTPGACRHS